jgi:hypothetical protein
MCTLHLNTEQWVDKPPGCWRTLEADLTSVCRQNDESACFNPLQVPRNRDGGPETT